MRARVGDLGAATIYAALYTYPLLVLAFLLAAGLLCTLRFILGILVGLPTGHNHGAIHPGILVGRPLGILMGILLQMGSLPTSPTTVHFA